MAVTVCIVADRGRKKTNKGGGGGGGGGGAYTHARGGSYAGPEVNSPGPGLHFDIRRVSGLPTTK